MKTLVVSDVHLTVAADGHERMAAFVRFLRTIDPAEFNRIIILGDLFDFWFEYQHVIYSGYFDVLRVLADLRDGGVQFYFVCGNHDFWAGRFLRDDLGFSIHPDRLTLTFGDKAVLFIHGDGINPRDTGYRIYKRIARARCVVWLFGLLHPDWAMALARAISRGSRRLTQSPDLSKGSEVQPLRDFARRTLEAGDADVVMCGHCHQPVREEYPGPHGAGLYINTGDWLFHRSYVVWDGDAFRLESLGGEAAGEPVAAEGTQRTID